MKKMFIAAVTLGVTLLTIAIGNQTTAEASEIDSILTEELIPGTVTSSIDDSDDQLPGGISPRASYITKQKTVEFYLGKVSYVPSTRYYEEYNSSYQIWQSGTLNLSSSRRNSNSEVWATYKGTIGGFKYW